jgi:hypothetical protein
LIELVAVEDLTRVHAEKTPGRRIDWVQQRIFGFVELEVLGFVERRDERVGSRFAAHLLDQQVLEIVAKLDLKPKVGLERLAQGLRLERRALVDGQLLAATQPARHARGATSVVDERQRAGVLAVELTNLPLPRQEPQGVADMRGQRVRKVIVARTRLESIVKCDFSHLPTPKRRRPARAR